MRKTLLRTWRGILIWLFVCYELGSLLDYIFFSIVKLIFWLLCFLLAFMYQYVLTVIDFIYSNFLTCSTVLLSYKLPFSSADITNYFCDITSLNNHFIKFNFCNYINTITTDLLRSYYSLLIEMDRYKKLVWDCLNNKN